ncbi:MAG: plasmid mobilization relaxosome protein MobC, partial [Pseudonocardia sp.]|nr:plasmid mobilization relaxosome protein MobC [Pseudonocardia sp.]
MTRPNADTPDRQPRVQGGRRKQVHVRLDEVQSAEVERMSAALGMTAAAFLARAGAGQIRMGGLDELVWRRTAAGELAAALRQLRWAGGNLNQVARYAHGHDGRLPDSVARTVAAVEAAAGEVARVAAALDPAGRAGRGPGGPGGG